MAQQQCQLWMGSLQVISIYVITIKLLINFFNLAIYDGKFYSRGVPEDGR